MFLGLLHHCRHCHLLLFLELLAEVLHSSLPRSSTAVPTLSAPQCEISSESAHCGQNCGQNCGQGLAGGGDAISLPSSLCCAANTGIVNHTHSRMGSIMSTGIVQGNEGVGRMGVSALTAGPPTHPLACSLSLPLTLLWGWAGEGAELALSVHTPPLQGRPAPRAAVAAVPVPTMRSTASSPWVALPSRWPHPCPSQPTPCIMGARPLQWGMD